jgi:nucleotide-binding universal stress UspA family protein
MTRHSQDSDRRHIVVGVDDSPQSEAAVRWAAAQAGLIDAELRLVHVWALEPSDMYGSTADIRDVVLPDLRARLLDMVTGTIGPSSDQLTWTLEIIQGDPGRMLVERARSARLLVLGTGEHVGVRRLVNGSVSHYCLSHAQNPVVAVPRHAQSPAATSSTRPDAMTGTSPR